MVFVVGQVNHASDIWLGHTLVAMATNESAITQLLQEIRP